MRPRRRETPAQRSRVDRGRKKDHPAAAQPDDESSVGASGSRRPQLPARARVAGPAKEGSSTASGDRGAMAASRSSRWPPTGSEHPAAHASEASRLEPRPFSGRNRAALVAFTRPLPRGDGRVWTEDALRALHARRLEDVANRGMNNSVREDLRGTEPGPAWTAGSRYASQLEGGRTGIWDDRRRAGGSPVFCLGASNPELGRPGRKQDWHSGARGAWDLLIGDAQVRRARPGYNLDGNEGPAWVWRTDGRNCVSASLGSVPTLKELQKGAAAGSNPPRYAIEDESWGGGGRPATSRGGGSGAGGADSFEHMHDFARFIAGPFFFNACGGRTLFQHRPHRACRVGGEDDIGSRGIDSGCPEAVPDSMRMNSASHCRACGSTRLPGVEVKVKRVRFSRSGVRAGPCLSHQRRTGARQMFEACYQETWPCSLVDVSAMTAGVTKTAGRGNPVGGSRPVLAISKLWEKKSSG